MLKVNDRVVIYTHKGLLNCVLQRIIRKGTIRTHKILTECYDFTEDSKYYKMFLNKKTTYKTYVFLTNNDKHVVVPDHPVNMLRVRKL